jgi:uncharacterized membrane protein YfcA
MVAAAALLLGSFVQGASGFAFSLISLPLLTMVMPQESAVPMLALLGLPINAVVLFSSRGQADPKRFLPLLVAGVAGTLPGILLLQALPEGPLRLIAGVTVTITAAVYIAGGRVRFRNERAAMIPVGLVSGILNGLMTFSGPPVIIFLANQEAEKEEFRAGLSLYFLGLNLLSIPMLAMRGLLGGGLLTATAQLLPAAALGSVLGAAVSRRIPQRAFRRTVLVLLAVLGLSVSVSALA